ncbi:C-type lectin domain family 2 member B-like [Melanerpes formicivorus]|uniref:C-type lectin domain family 2 member B-like n=1 Tax=Melanerpes formicivorus TaxID=211600 RepID=UPI00358F5A9F
MGRSESGQGEGGTRRGDSRGCSRAGSQEMLPETGLESRSSAGGLLSNVWLWRGVAGVLTAAVILILYIQFVNHSSAKAFPVCPSLELCPSGWLYFQRRCYYLSDSEASWSSSQSFCSLQNASLLVIENHEELSFMMKITKQDPWIGLYKRNEEFFWVNGKALNNKLIEVKGSGSCAYLEPKGVSASGCYLTRKWICSLNVSLAW